MKRKLILLIGTAAAGFVVLKLYTLAVLLGLAPTYRAKLHCSCRFVTGQSESFCEAWALPPILPARATQLSVDESQRTVTATSWLEKATARWVSESGGCILQP